MSFFPGNDPLIGDAFACDAIELMVIPNAKDIDGFQVRRALPTAKRRLVGPFIFFDRMGPAILRAGQALDVRGSVLRGLDVGRLDLNISGTRIGISDLRLSVRWRALGGEGIAGKLFDVARDAGAPTALRDLGMPEDGIDRAVEITLANPYDNPRPIDPVLIRRLIANAWAGVRPDHSTYAV